MCSLADLVGKQSKGFVPLNCYITQHFRTGASELSTGDGRDSEGMLDRFRIFNFERMKQWRTLRFEELQIEQIENQKLTNWKYVNWRWDMAYSIHVT